MMMNVYKKRLMEIIVGLFMIAGVAALAVLAFEVSGLVPGRAGETYTVTAAFDNIGDLKVRAPVRLAGVRIGQVTAIRLDPETFRADVSLSIEQTTRLPDDTAASILTEGLLGSNYVGLTPGFAAVILKNKGRIETTHPALILENLIGQLLFSLKGNHDDTKLQH